MPQHYSPRCASNFVSGYFPNRSKKHSFFRFFFWLDSKRQNILCRMSIFHLSIKSLIQYRSKKWKIVKNVNRIHFFVVLFYDKISSNIVSIIFTKNFKNVFDFFSKFHKILIKDCWNCFVVSRNQIFTETRSFGEIKTLWI